MTVRNSLAALAAIFILTVAFSTSGISARTLAAADLPVTTPTPQPLAATTAQETTPQQNTQTDEAIRTAFQQAVVANPTQVLGFVIYDTFVQHIEYSKDGASALLWVALKDSQTGEAVATEPGLSIARNLKQGPPTDPASWSIMMPSGATWTDQLKAMPAELLTQDIRNQYLTPQPAADGTAAALLFSGYKLPWTAGLSKYVTNSIGHVYSVSGGLASCPSSCRYAFDFADGTMFPLLAAKGGTVKAYKLTCPNNQSSCTNYLILEDQSTSPTSYQLYYHMAYNTLSARLRTVGAVVMQGEYLGNADNTGYSTGSHLHFHVYTSPTLADYSWGNSIDITFDDVTTNGGRPRTCAEARAYPSMGSQCMPSNLYISGNTPAHPPSGTFDLPADRQVIASRTVHVQGSASDDIQVTRIQVMANYDGTWKGIGDITPTGNGPYSSDIDLCTANVPDGPFKMTVRIFDREGSQAPGIPEHQVIKNFACSGTSPQPPKDLSILFPQTSRAVPVVPFQISASATDYDGGPVAKVDFYWHGPDWTQNWVKLGSDTNASDGWNYEISPTQYGDVQGSAVYIQATGRTGGVKGAVLWDLQPDWATPVSALDSLPARIGSTVFALNWSAADPQNDIDHFELQYQENTGSGMSGWKDWQDSYHTMPIPGTARSAWFTGSAGVSYNFRLRAVDKAGNAEAWPGQPEASTSLSATCTPDPYESAGQSQSATSVVLSRNDYSDVFNFCKSTQSGADDTDWSIIDARAGETLLLSFIPDGGGTAFSVKLYGSAYAQPLSWLSSDYENWLNVKWTVPATGRYYLEIKPIWSSMFGTDMKYQVWYGPGSWSYLPMIGH